MLTLDKIFNASVVLKDIVRKTSLVAAPGIAPGCELYLKPENLQNTGSFKLRGSGYKIAQLSDEEKQRGVIACSAEPRTGCGIGRFQIRYSVVDLSA